MTVPILDMLEDINGRVVYILPPVSLNPQDESGFKGTLNKGEMATITTPSSDPTIKIYAAVFEKSDGSNFYVSVGGGSASLPTNTSESSTASLNRAGFLCSPGQSMYIVAVNDDSYYNVTFYARPN